MAAIEVVSATRLAEADFWREAPLGISLRRLAHDKRLVPQVAFSNTKGLPEVYNARIADTDRILVFVHDDVWIDDYFLADRVAAGLAVFDVIGVAGNRRRVPRQPAWILVDAKPTWDTAEHLSGAVAHGRDPFGTVASYGPVPAACELLDGVFLAARADTLARAGVAFDPRFDFDFYDLDFCRTARQRGLRLGTWPICLTHRSAGKAMTERWNRGYRTYLEKWD